MGARKGEIKKEGGKDAKNKEVEIYFRREIYKNISNILAINLCTNLVS